MLAATNVAARAQGQHRPFSPLRGNGAGDIQRSMKPLMRRHSRVPMLFANCAIIPAGFGDNRKMVRKHADSPPVFFGTDEDVDLRGEIAEDKEVILDGHRFRAEEPQAAPPPGEARAESPVHRLRNSRQAWLKAMHGLSLVCAMTLSIIESGYRLEWNEGGPPPRYFKRTTSPRTWTRNSSRSPSARASHRAR